MDTHTYTHTHTKRETEDVVKEQEQEQVQVQVQIQNSTEQQLDATPVTRLNVFVDTFPTRRTAFVLRLSVLRTIFVNDIFYNGESF